MKRLVIVLVAACGGGGATGSDASVDAPAPTHHGYVWMQSNSYHAQNVAHDEGAAGALFDDAASLCTTHTSFGACTVSYCTDVLPVSHVYSAGTMTIAGASAPIVLTFPINGTYPDFHLTGVLFTGGESLAVTASGADVPPFAGSVVAPTRATITSPAAPPEETLTIAQSSDFTFTWTGFETGTLHVGVVGGPNASTQVDCSFDAAAATGTIPAQALMMVPTGGTIYFHMESIRDAEVDAGDWAVTLHATTQAVWPTDTLAGGVVTLQ